MANQQEMIRQTIAGMKRAVHRSEDSSETDNDSFVKATNRGNKLKRKARFVEQGHLNLASGPKAYRRRIDYNGFSRHIIHRNPPLVDYDGDVVESDEENPFLLENAEPEEDPYSDIKIENLLMPLTSAGELPNHASMSVPYTSKALEEMIQNAEDMLHRERAMLSKLKYTMAEFQGDDIWTSCGQYYTDRDVTMLGTTSAAAEASAPSSVLADLDGHVSASLNGEAVVAETQSEVDLGSIPNGNHSWFIETKGNPATTAADGSKLRNTGVEDTKDLDMLDERNGAEEGSGKVVHLDGSSAGEHINGASTQFRNVANIDALPSDKGAAEATSGQSDSTILKAATQERSSKPEEQTEVDVEMEEDNENDAEHPPHRMTTRARAQAEESSTFSQHSPPPPADDVSAIHPFYAIPFTAYPDRSNGIGEQAAQDMRRVLYSYVQKQEEVCRGAARLHDGLLKAKRLRDTVMEWCTQEGHVGEMSDGEDWYDKAKWGLEEDLKKGEEADDEDAVTSGKKTTRNRRAAAAAA